MYVGCLVVVSPRVGVYCVSSRSFPSRRVVDRDDALVVGPTPDAPETDNLYTAYNCVREGGDYVVVGNGLQVNSVAEKLDLSHPPRDMLAGILLAFDYEKDDYDMPRTAGAVGDDEVHIDIVRKDALVVEVVTEPMLMATYEEDDPHTFDLNAETAADAARELYDHEFEYAVRVAAAIVGDVVETSLYNGE